MEWLLQTLGALEPAVVYVVLAVLVAGESAAVVAVLMPGELALLVAGALAARGHLSLPVLLAVGIAAAVVGHLLGYQLGRRYGLSVLRWRGLRRYAATVDGTRDLVARHGGMALVLGRWTNVSRVLVPLVVGAYRMPYRTFTLYNVLGGGAWVVTFVLLGAAAGTSLPAVERVLGQLGWWLTVGLAVVPLWWVVRRHGQGARPGKDGEEACPVTASTRSRS